MTDSATIIAASLNSDQLEDSINDLVSMVAKKTKEMADNFTGEVKRMEDAVKNLGNIKIDSGGAADGGSSRRTSKQKEEESQVKATTQAYKEQKTVVGELAMSFDNLNTAITKSNSKLAAKFDVTEQQKVQQLEAQRTSIEDKIVARQIEIDESYRSQLATLSKTRSELESKANLTSKEQADLKHVTTEWERINKIVRDISSRPIVAADDPTGSIGRLQQQLVETNRQLDESRKRIQEMNFERAKMYDGSLSGLVQNAQSTMKYQNDTLKKSFEDLLKKPTHDVDEMRAKMERLQTFLNNIKPLNIFSPELIANGERAINKLKNEIQKFNDKPTKQAFADALKLPDRTQSEIITKIKRIRDAIKGVEGTKIVSEAEIARANSLIESLRDKWSKLYNAPRDRQLRIDFADALKMPTNNIDEIAAKLMRLQYILQEMRGMEVLSPQQIANGNNQISALLSKLEAEMSLRQQINAVEQADMQNAQKRIELEAKYGEEVAKAAAIANDWLQKNKEAAILNKEGTFVIQDPKAGQTVGQSIEAQLLAYKAINGELNLELEVQKAIQNTVEIIEKAEQRRIALAQGGNAASNKSFADYEDLRTAIAAVLRVRESEVSLANSEDASYKALSLTLKQLKQAYESLSASQRKSENADALIASIHETQRAMQEIQKQMSRPVNLANALALPEKTIDDISYKVQMLRAYAQGINIETNAGNEELRRVMSTIEGLNEGLKNAQKTTKQITIESNNIKFDNIAKMPADGLKQVGEKIKEVKQYINELKNQPIVDEKNLKRAEALYDKLIKQSQKLNETKGSHSNVNDALSVRVKTLDDIAKKMQRLQAIRQNLDINKQKADIDRINASLGELKKQQDGVLQRNANMIKSNNALGRSWNYMKNRLAFYFTVGASTQFIKNLIEVRSQYEMNERALGILINSAERGTQIFNELSQMALVSPYTLIELSAAAKQLTAYDIAARDVVDTTRRLADMASAVGVPIERLTYALGQIKAYGYLNSRDARMFANAGIPLVKQLSDYYTELEGKMVSTADVYDRMKKKAIDYNSVMSVITKMTDEGGKFFDFQAKMADTLKVRLANLTLAWNNMLNDMGKETQGVLTWSIGALRDLFLQWKNLYGALNEVAFVFGVAKALQFLGVCAHAAGIGFGSLNKYMTLNALLGTKLATTVRTLGSSFMALVHSPLVWFTMAALLVTEIGDAFINADKATKEFNKSLRDSAKTTYEDLNKFAEQYKNVRDSLYTTQKTAIGNIYDPSTGKAAATAYANQTVGQDISASEAKKVWEAMREQIELSSHASDEYISKLLSIENVSERLRQGFQILDDIQTVSAALKDIGDDGIKVTQGWAAWWNAWQGSDGLIKNIKDVADAEKELVENFGSVEAAKQRGSKLYSDYEKRELENFRKDLKVTTDSVIDFINLNGWSGDTGKIDEVFKQVTDRLTTQGNLDPQTAFTLQREVEVARAKAAKEALEIRIDDEKKALATASDEISKQQIQKNLETLEQQKRDFDKFNGENRAYWNDFTKYIKERHISELTAAYNSMTDHGKKAMDFQSEEWQKHVHDWANRYEKSHNLATDSVFNRLRNWINDANTWSVFIKMTISTEDGKSVYKQLEEYDKAADDAWKTMQRLDKRISQLRKKGAKEVEGAETGAIDLSRVSADDKELTEALKERTQAQKDYNNAVEKGGESKKENAAASKAQKAAESELAKALKDELQLIEKVRSAYKERVNDGMSHADAIAKSVTGYEKSVANINKVLEKYGIKLDLTKFVGIANPHELQEMFKQQLNVLVGKAKPTEIQALEVELQKVDLDVDKYDLTKITKGLNNQLDRLKEEYELAVALDADPELGSMFASYMGVNLDELPRNAEQAARKAQKYIDQILAENNSNENIDINELMNKKAFDNWVETSGHNLDDTLVKAVSAFRTYLIKLRTDETKSQMQEWNKLLEKYAEYETKINKIQNDASKERVAFAQQFGNQDQKNLAINLQTQILAATDPQVKQKLIEQLQELIMSIAGDDKTKLNIAVSINNKQVEELAKASFEQFQKSPEWILATGDLVGMTDKALGGLIDKLEEFKKSAKDLDSKQIKNLNNALKNLYKQRRQGNPFSALINAMSEAKNRALDLQPEIDKVSAEIERLESIRDKGNIAETADELEKLRNRLNELKKVQQDVSKLSTTEWVNSLKSSYDSIKTAIGLFDDLAKAISGAEESDLDKVFKVIDKAVSGAQTGSSFGTYGAIIGAVVGAASGIITEYKDVWNGQKKINDLIKVSTDRVSMLTTEYNKLQRAIDDAYGMEAIGQQKLALLNKQAQLAELERQLELEKSRSAKNRDLEKISELEDKVEEARYELGNATREMVQDLLGIGDAQDWADNFVTSMIQAFRKGEDYMQQYDDAFQNMVDSLIAKAIAGKLIGEKMEEWLTELEYRTYGNAESNPDVIAAQEEVNKWQDYLNTLIGLSNDNVDVPTEELDRVKKELWNAQQKYAELYQKASELSGEDVEEFRNKVNDWRDDLKNKFTEYMEMFGVEFGSDKEGTGLSALQQGLQSMSESTANALEGYMNGVSQQVYYHSSLLEQIRDVIMGTDSDIQLGVQGQMLLQLQNNYIIMQSIQSMMEGWSTPSGQGIRVELLS